MTLDRRRFFAGVTILLACCLMGRSAALADPPDPTAPLVIVSLSSYDELLSDAGLLGELSDNPNLAASVESMLKLFTNNKGLAGLDKTRPSGAVLLGGDALRWYAFLPVTDLDKLIDVAKPFFTKVQRTGGGTYQLTAGTRSVYVRQNDGWAILSDRNESLAGAPADPGKLLAGMSGKYDMAIRAHVHHVPAAQRERFVAGLRTEFERSLTRRLGEDDSTFLIRKAVTEKTLKTLTAAAGQLEHITLGWSLDRKTRGSLLDLDIVAIEGTPAAEKLARRISRGSNFTGFLLPEATLSGAWTADLGAINQSAGFDAFFAAIQTRALQTIDDGLTDDELASVAKELLTGVLAVIRADVSSGKSDGGLSVLLEPSAATLVAGRYVAHDELLQETFINLVDAVRRKHPELVARVLKMNVDQHGAIRFHTVTFDLPDDMKDHDRLVRLVGRRLQVVVGVGPNSVYLAAGRDAMQTLKRAIERSESNGTQPIRPMEFSLSLAKLAAFTTALDEGSAPTWARRATPILQRASGKDHVRVSLLPVPHGMRIRIEAEEGVLRLLAAMRKAD